MWRSLCKIRPFNVFLTQARFVRPIVKLGKDRFELSIDVRQFNKDELRVKARKEFIIIEGKQERRIQNGCVIRQFVRKYRLPSGCNPQYVYSTISEEGILTVTAPRQLSDINLPNELCVPIKTCGPSEKDDPQCTQDPSKKTHPCDYYSQKKTKGPEPPTSGDFQSSPPKN